MELITVLLIAIFLVLVTSAIALIKILKHIDFIDLFIFTEWMKWSGQDDDLCEDCQHNA